MIKKTPDSGHNIDIASNMCVYPYEKVPLTEHKSILPLLSVNMVQEAPGQLLSQDQSSLHGAQRLQHETLLCCLDIINQVEQPDHDNQSKDVSDLLQEFLQHFKDQKLIDIKSMQAFATKFQLTSYTSRSRKFHLPSTDMHENYKCIYDTFRVNFPIFFLMEIIVPMLFFTYTSMCL